MVMPRRPSSLPTAMQRAQPAAPVAMTKTGVPATLPDRNIATQLAPATSQGQADSRSLAYNYFTKVGTTEILYPGQRQWVTITLTLESAGPVAVGMLANLQPITSGKGILLTTDLPLRLTIAKGTILYITSTAVSRVKVQVEPLPWLEQITGLLGGVIAKAGGVVGMVGQGAAAAARAVTGRK